MRTIIENIIKKNRCNFTSIIKSKYKNLYEEINQTDSNKIKFSEKLYCWLYGEKLCAECNKKTKFIGINEGYREFCSNECVNKSKVIKDRIKSSFIKKYGFDNVSKNENIKDKKKLTMLNKYGVECPFKLKSSIEKRNIKVKDKFKINGIKRIENLRVIKRKLFIESCNNGSRLGDIIPLFNFNNFTNIKDKNLLFKCGRCNTEFRHHLQWGTTPICRICNPFSTYEEEIKLFLKNGLKIEDIVENSFDIISPLQIDIFIPGKKIAIEFNGDYWHSNIFKNKFYHLNKTVQCEKKQIKLIHVFENDWLTNKDVIKNTIKDIIFNNKPTILVENGLVDRSVYNKLFFNCKSTIIGELPPKLIKRNNFYVWNCGYFYVK